MGIMRAGKTAIAQIHNAGLKGGCALAPRDFELGPRGRPIACIGHRLRLANCDEQQFPSVKHDRVSRLQIAQVARFERGLGNRGHRSRLKMPSQKVKQRRLRRLGLELRRMARAVGQTTRARNQADTHLDQPHITLQCHDPLGAVQRNLAAPAQRQSVYRSHHRHLRIAHPQHHLLQILDIALDRLRTTLHKGGHGRLQIGTGREGLIGRPDHQASIARFGRFDRAQQTLAKALIDQMHLGLE